MSATQDLTPFLAESDIVNFSQPEVAALAKTLRRASPEATARACFDWVRDSIQHCVDFQREEVTVSAAEVLQIGTGFCYAKSHLLVALCRANGIPAGFGYQRLTFDGPTPPYCLHGFAAVWLEGFGWYRCDARGNRAATAERLGIDCQFDPPRENLAFPIEYPGECTYPNIWPEPLPELIQQLQAMTRVAEYYANPIDVVPADHHSVPA
ncbi:transglutaminase-like domain-containing protein [Andreprevotia chitinilytica]|uniref:transglutaminase-like domain-containing protein n=1 Tax=Andreprevotia chitinilytica TaxID=396808 RepID=UPI000553DBC7|nr:transglutaminase family protein [Andreprevotia chitinilytica]